MPSEREPGQEENRSAKKIVKPAMMEKIKIVKKKKKEDRVVSEKDERDLRN